MAEITKRKKILFIIDFIYSLNGGTESQVFKLINNLDSDKYDLYLISMRNTPWIMRHGSNLKCHIKAYSYNIWNHKDPGNLTIFFRMRNYIKRLSPDIVICFFRASYIFGVLAARLAGVSNIISTRRDYGLWLDKRFIYPLRLANRFVKLIVTNSYRVKELTSAEEKFQWERIAVIYNGLEIQDVDFDDDEKVRLKRNLGIPVRNKVVGIVAGLRPMKRHRTFLRAAREVLRKRKDVDFIIVGDGSLRSELENSAVRLTLAERVHFLGWKNDVLPFLSIFDVGVNCSANEGLSNAIMEYMAYGVPCIVSRAGGNEELIEHGVNGYTFELDNYKELTQLILFLLEDKQERKEFIEKSKEKVFSCMSLDGMISEYDKLFGSLSK